MKAAIIRFPGSNRDRDSFYALKTVCAIEPIYLYADETNIPKLDLIIIPGGFSYGDHLRPGAIAAKTPIMQEIIKKAASGLPILGICNGFQILLEAGLLPG